MTNEPARPSTMSRWRFAPPSWFPTGTVLGLDQDVPPRPLIENSQFRGARNVAIHGGQFNSRTGHHTVVTVNLNQTEIGGEHVDPAHLVQSNQDEITPGEAMVAGPSLRPGEHRDAIIREPSSNSGVVFASRRSCNIYENHLSPKGRGFPLWIPEPNNNLSFPYRRKGIQIGDVGIITPAGSFSFLFNICVSRDNPINPQSLPEDFSPIHPPIDPIDIRRFAEFKSGSYLASTSIEKSQDDTSPGLSFRTSASEGAILTMPEGAMSQDLENIPRFRGYAADNVNRWYRYINGTRGREAKNGDVRLVVGCDKATSWGMATLSNMNQHSQLKFKPLGGHGSDSPNRGYTWEYSGMAEVRVGPDQEETDELRREDPEDSLSRSKYLNQCLFVRTLNITMNDDEWENLNQQIGVGSTSDSVTEKGTGAPFHSLSNRDPPSDSTQSTSSANGYLGIQRRVGDGQFTASANRLIFSAPPTATSCHPSRILNEAILKMVPTAKMVVTHDEDWYPYIQEGMTISPDPERFFASLSTANVREDNGVVYLEPKVSREIKYFANLEQLSIELKKNSSNLEEYLCGADYGRSARWNEIVYLLELCFDALSPSASDSDRSIPSQKPLDSSRMREMESLLGSLLIDELFLDKPGVFDSIYAFRPLSRTKPSGSNFRIETFTKLSSILGRVSTRTEHLIPPLERRDEQLSIGKIGSRHSKNHFPLYADLYLLYLALGEPADLKQTIECFRQKQLPECTSVDSSPTIPTEEDAKRGPLPGDATRPMNQPTSYMRETMITSPEQVPRDTITSSHSPFFHKRVERPILADKQTIMEESQPSWEWATVRSTSLVPQKMVNSSLPRSVDLREGVLPTISSKNPLQTDAFDFLMSPRYTRTAPMFEEICLVCGKQLNDDGFASPHPPRPQTNFTSSPYCSDDCRHGDLSSPSISSSSSVLSSPNMGYAIGGEVPALLPSVLGSALLSPSSSPAFKAEELKDKKDEKAATFRRKVLELTTSECPPSTTSTSQHLPNAAKDVPSDDTDPRNPKSSDPSSPQDKEPRDTGRKSPRKRKDNLFAMLQPIVEFVESSTTCTPKSAVSLPPFGSSLYGVDSTFARRMEEVGRLRRLQSQSHIDLRADDETPTTSSLARSPKHAKSSSEATPSCSRPLPNIPLENVSNALHKETRPPKAPPPPTPPKVPVKPSPVVPHIDREAISHAAELQDQLDRAVREAKAFETELARVTTQSANDKERLERELRTAKQDNVVLVDQVELITQRNDDAISEMKANLRKLTVEKRGWQEQLDTMHHKVVQAERQIRCLDHITRAKLEAREETTFGSTKRTKLAMAQQQQPSSELIKAFKDLNEEIFQAANLLVENLDRTHFHPSTTDLSGKAEKLVGTHVTEMLKAQAGGSKNVGFRHLLMMVVLEVFFVHWCSAIIEGFYPKRTTFADLLVELSSQTTVVTAGKQLRVLETQSTASVEFPTWASEIIQDLSDVLLIGGLKIRAQRQALFTTKIQSIIALAYDLRAALAEKDIYGGIELVVESPDLPFQPKWMEEAYTTDRRGTSTMLTQMEPIAGTTGMGLKRTNVGGTQNDAQTYLLKPKVVLARVLRESP